MRTENIVLPRYRVGAHILRDAADIFAQQGRRALVIGGRTAMDVALPMVRAACAQGGVEIVDAQLYGGECTYGNMERLKEIALARGADMIVGIGGGKALDTAKGCAHLLGMPVVTVPTIASTCAAVTALSVVYTEESVFIESMFHEQPPAFALIDLEVIAHAPACYLRAGMGDAIAKHVECMLSSRGRELSHSCALAVAISTTSCEPLLKYGAQAMEDVRRGAVTDALKQAVLANIVSTGLVSLLIEEIYNGALAHALFYGLTRIPHFEEKCLHGDAVGYGVLVQEQLDGKTEALARIRSFMRQVGMPTCLRETGFELTRQVLDEVVPAALKALRDARVMPYAVTPEMLEEALQAVEKM